MNPKNPAVNLSTSPKPVKSPIPFWPRCLAGAAALLLTGSATAQLQTAGTVFVNFDASILAAGTVTDITNTGTLGGYFESRSGAVATLGNQANGTIVASSNGVSGINLTASVVMQLRAGTNGALIAPPAGIVGPNATCSIEVWALNPGTLQDESMVAWGRRGFASQNMAFEYGNDSSLGAVTHTTIPDMPWDPFSGAPLNTYWHHLVYTYDGTTESVYSDGALINSKVGAVNIATNAGIMFGAQWTNSGTVISTTPVPATLLLARVRIHDGALTPSQVLNNFNFEKSQFIAPPATPQFLTAGPVHRYSFNLPDTNNATGLAIHDSVGGLDGVIRSTNSQMTAQIAHGRLVLPAGETGTRTGPQMQSAYGDLPNGLLSANSTNNGGTGEISIEVWYREVGGVGNARVFDIGSCGTLGSPGVEVPDVGGRPSTDVGLDYLFFSSSVASAGANMNARRLAFQNKDPLPAGTTTNSAAPTSDEYTMYTHQTDRHIVVTWKESTGQVIDYENGVQVGSLITSNTMNSINDVNVWLGRSVHTDPEFVGEFDEVRFYNYVLTAGQAVGDFLAGPETINLNEQPPAIVAQPLSQTIYQGSAVTFYTLASGSPAVSYQWSRNGTPIAGATSNYFAIASAGPANNGDVYSCVLSNFASATANTLTSSNAVLTVIPNQAPVGQFLHETRDGTRDNFTGTIGGSFKSGNTPVVVTHLGFYDMNNDGLSRSHNVGLLNTTNGVLLTSVLVPSGTVGYLTNGYRYVALATPFYLTPNTTYTLSTETFSGDGDGWPDVFVPGSWNTYFVGANDGTTRTGRFLTSGVWPANPTSSSTANGAYAPANLATLPVGPAIAYMPQTQVTNYSGSSLSLAAFVNGDLPVTVQWYKSPSTLLTGQTNASLNIPVLHLSDAGDYYVIANNSSGPVQSANVTLTVLPGTPVGIAQQPSDTSAPDGYPVSFTVVANGTPPFTYQWSSNGVPVIGATTDTLNISTATLAISGSSYSVVISNIADSVAYSATSAVATLTVQPNQALPTQFLCETHDGNRDDYTGNVGGSFQVGSSDALVTHLGYYDYMGDGLLNDHHVGIFNASGTLLAQVLVPAGTSAYLTNGYRWVALDPIFVLTNNSTYYLGAEVVMNDGDNWPDVFTPANWNPYYVGLNGPSSRSSHFAGGAWPVNPTSGSAANSRYAASDLAVLPIGPFFASISPSNNTVYVGDTATFTSLVNGQAPLTIQWYKAPGTLLTGQTNTTLSFTTTSTNDSGDFYISGANPQGTTPSPSVHLTVLPLTTPIVTQSPQSQTVYAHQQAVFTFTAIGQQPLTNQWYFQGAPIPGATNPTLTLLNTSNANAGAYSVLVGNVLGTTNSASATLTILNVTGGSYADTVMSAGPLVYYRFSEVESSTTAFNLGSLGNIENGLYEGSYGPTAGPQPPTFPNFEATNEAVFLDQNGFGVSSGDVAIPALNLDGTGGAHTTLAAWVNSAAPQAPYAGIVFNRGGAGANGLGVKTNLSGVDELEYHWNNTYYTFESGLLVPAGQWVFAALVVEPAKATLYLYNGSTVQTATNVAAHTAVPFAETSYVGWDPTATTARRFYGAIDEPMIFNRALSAFELNAIYVASVVPKVQITAALVGGQIVLTWPQGILQRAPDVNGPYVDDNTVTSPYTNTPSGAHEFYQVRIPVGQ